MAVPTYSISAMDYTSLNFVDMK